MLRVTLHAGLLTERSAFNVLGTLDIAYAKKEALAEYLVALSLTRGGEMAPAILAQYPRWSASLWDLVARALTAALYGKDQAPPSAKPDRRCAYATKLCATIERSSAVQRGVHLGTLEVAQTGQQRGRYSVTLEQDILPSRSAEFEYGCKALNPADLALRAMCWTLFGQDVLGPGPRLILPPTMPINGEDRFHLASLDEPARTGFVRHLAQLAPHETQKPLEQLQPAKAYIDFLQRS